MSINISNIEIERKRVQTLADKSRTKLERNMLGQYSTPNELAIEIMEYTKVLLKSREKVSFLDPALGSGSFYSAFLQVFNTISLDYAYGVEIDKEYADLSRSLWGPSGLEVINEDFTDLTFPALLKKVDLLICNPPYVRHHHLSETDKTRFVRFAKSNFGISISKLAGLYCHFMLMSHNFVKDNGISVWLIPGEFLDVNYGVAIKEYLLNRVELIRVHRFNPENVKFSDALVSSVVLWFKKNNQNPNSTINFTYGDSILNPSKTTEIEKSILKSEEKWSGIFQTGKSSSSNLTSAKIKDLFYIKRGIATGNNDYFILSEKTIEKKGLPKHFFKSILPSPKFIVSNVIEADSEGNPVLDDRYYVLDCSLSKDKIDKKHQNFIDYINYGESKGVSLGYICKNRNPWYSQEKRDIPLFICNYIGRENSTKAFRFILNKSKSIVTNSYLGLYPKPIFNKLQESDPNLSLQILDMLNSITSIELIKNGRVYGGGMYKLEPKELENVGLNLPVNLKQYVNTSRQLTLFESKTNYAGQQYL
ncbi:MAG: N-6 DNA methylase [Bacteroidota bacterium]